MLPRHNTEEQKKEYAKIKRSTVFLGQVASLLRNRTFVSWFTSNEARFDWATQQIHNRLRKDLMFQVDQSLGRRAADGLNEAARLRIFADQCDEFVAEVEASHSIKNTKTEKRFTFARDQEPAALIFDFLSRVDTFGFAREGNGGFYVWNGVSSLVVFVRARQTLALSTQSPAFESLLGGLNEEYLLSGYPHDLLAHDAHAIRVKDPIKALMIRDDYCATHIVRKGEELIPFPQGKIIHFSNAA